MTQKLFFIRHGNTFEPNEIPKLIGNNLDLPLTLEGQHQALKLALYFKTKQIQPFSIYTGTLKRQKQTANIIANEFNPMPQVIHNPIFNEIDYGIWEGLTINEIKLKWFDEFNAWNDQAIWPSHIFKHTEQFYISNISKWITQISESIIKDSNLFIVSSQGILRYLLPLSESSWPEIVKEKQVSKYKINTGCFSKIYLKGSRLKIIKWNKKPKI